MAYSTEKAALLTKVLSRLSSLNVHQLVGHRDNLPFWIDEVVQATTVLDGYKARFRKIKDAQTQWVRAHEVKVSEFCPTCGGACEFGPTTPDPPRRVPSSQLQEATVELREAARMFIVRLYRAHMLSREDLLAAAERIQTGFEPKELERPQPDDRDPPKAAPVHGGGYGGER